MRLLRDPIFGGRLHIVVSVRDNVFASILRSEHATRYRTDPHIRILAWDRPAIGYLLGVKLARLAETEVMSDDRHRDVASWLGADAIRNRERGVDEAIEDYLLRHTRLLPRDVVLMGNALTQQVVRAKRAGVRRVHEQDIRETVARVASWCGNEQLAVCANQVLGDMIPRGAVRGGAVDTFLASDAYRRELKEQIGEMLRSLGTDQIDGSTVRALGELACETLGEEIDLPTVLWQNGLLGYGDRRLPLDEWIFHGVEDVDQFHIPLDRERYALHPVVLDALGFRGDGLGSAPVRPWRRGA
jgi:hypothetical protein